MERVAFYYSPRFLEHDPGRGHPEAAGRLQAVLARLERTALPLDRREPSPASRTQLLTVHSEEHLTRLAE
ncbi:MAG: hypothetical protein HY303_01955 [Candidatus Wallbacteria bacterium]|nr:hypothetical protein [Candidatus Wallbacteria bacterium]